MKNVLNAIWSYFKDWQNWLVHSLVGIGFLVLIVWVPVEWWIKLIVVGLVVVFNVIRMRISKKHKIKKQEITKIEK